MTDISDQKMADHTVKAFDADLAKLTGMITAMGDLAEKGLKDAVEALVRRDVDLANSVIALDRSNETMQRDIEDSATLLIARRQPVAYDLRLIVAVWETATELRRVGVLARNIANSVVTLDGNYEMPQPVHALRRLARAASERLRDVVKSVVDGDGDKAQDLWRSDAEIDDMYAGLCRELLTYMMADPHTSPSAVQFLFCAKNIELIGDHVTNIAEAAHYLAQGHRISRPFEAAAAPA
ncbi:MAG TPA: phosphate signaling complex protein PhoU [Xanthobacteraceae bacterium]|jgi:phosphate transport system protein|nr:phosphate signaling complex protein PhoU [Xanthobacteraceae bacterium]